ncbi:hypothetical protein GCM10023178_06670 [Actinomadura luteofluorescens]
MIHFPPPGLGEPDGVIVADQQVKNGPMPAAPSTATPGITRSPSKKSRFATATDSRQLTARLWSSPGGPLGRASAHPASSIERKVVGALALNDPEAMQRQCGADDDAEPWLHSTSPICHVTLHTRELSRQEV